ncbi:hypothetical protein THAOC_19491, partial [Thalassiosira oceanica]
MGIKDANGSDAIYLIITWGPPTDKDALTNTLIGESSASTSHGSKSFAIKEMEVFQVCSKEHIKAAVELKADSIPLSESFAPPLNKALNKRLEALKRAEEAIARLEMQYDDEEGFVKRLACGETKDVVTLNVDGTRMTTTRATLRVFEDSVLARQFDDEVWSQQPQTNVREWNPDQVSAWAEDVYGLPQEAVNVIANHKVTGRELLSLNMEALKMMGLERPATMSLLLDEIRELGEKATDDSPFVEHNPYVFGKLLDFLRMRRLQKVGLVEDLSFPRVEASQQGRFSQLIEYYFPGDARKLARELPRRDAPERPPLEAPPDLVEVHPHEVSHGLDPTEARRVPPRGGAPSPVAAPDSARRPVGGEEQARRAPRRVEEER